MFSTVAVAAAVGLSVFVFLFGLRLALVSPLSSVCASGEDPKSKAGVLAWIWEQTPPWFSTIPASMAEFQRLKVLDSRSYIRRVIAGSRSTPCSTWINARKPPWRYAIADRKFRFGSIGQSLLRRLRWRRTSNLDHVSPPRRHPELLMRVAVEFGSLNLTINLKLIEPSHGKDMDHVSTVNAILLNDLVVLESTDLLNDSLFVWKFFRFWSRWWKWRKKLLCELTWRYMQMMGLRDAKMSSKRGERQWSVICSDKFAIQASCRDDTPASLGK